ncbi:MAG: autotransporter domain-containing protein [Acetobacteraceae bacterium]|nr:autotransporter domain-containing protein [Acetobacteraceae bacterium]
MPSDAKAQTFQAQGPAPIVADGRSGLANVPNSSAAAGAIGPVVVDPANPSRIWIGSVNGGVWSSTDGGSSWAALTDHLPSLSIGALAIDPSSPVDSRTLVAGFGNFSNAAGLGGSLAGLVMSENGGADWSAIGGSALYGHQISGVAVVGGTILAAASDAQGGLWRSGDHGNSFQQIAAIPGPVTSLAADPADPNRYYAAVVPPGVGQNAAVYVTGNAGTTWSPLFTAADSGSVVNGTPLTATQTLRVASGPNGSVAVGVANTAGSGAAAAGVFLYNAQTGQWHGLTMPAVAVSARDPSQGTFGINSGNQALTNFAVAIDPRNPNIVYVAGDTQALPSGVSEQDPEAPASGPPNGIGSTQYYATVFRLELAADGTSTATAMTNNFAAGGTAPHADSRVITFDSAGNLLLSSDGGLYVRSQPQSSAGSWNGLNTGLQLLEAYKAAYDPTTGSIIAAAQDNGTATQSARGSLSWSDATGGDGFNIGVNSTSLAGRSVLYFGSNSVSMTRVIADGPGQVGSGAALNFTVGGQALYRYEGLANADAIALSGQFELNRADPTRLAVGTNRVYVGRDPLDLNAGSSIPIPLTPIYQPAEATAVVTALAYGTRDNPGALLALYGGSAQPVMVSLAGTPAPGTLQPAAGWVGSDNPAAGVFDPRSAQRLYIADIANIYGSADGGTSFQNLRGNLPGSFGNLRAVEFLSNNGVNALFVGGQDSASAPGPPLYVAQATALTQWSGFGTGLPNAIIDNLRYSDQGDMLVVATLGRGVFALYDVTSFFPSATVLSFGAANNDSIPIASQLTDGIDETGRAFSRGLVKTGVGVLTLNVAAAYTGATDVNAGTMRAGATGVFAAGSAFTVATAGTLDLAGYAQTIGSLAGAGFVNLGAATLTTGGNDQSTVFSGMMAGQGGMLKQGAGTFTFSGLGGFTGPTTVASGTFDLASSGGLSGSVLVQPGAALHDAGAIGGALVSAGTVTVAATGVRVTLGGGLSLLPGGTLAVPVTGSGTSAGPAGGIAVGGAAMLNGALQLTHSPGSPGIADGALILADGVSGQFADVLGERPGARFALDYRPDRVVLVPLQNGFVDLAQNGNQRAVATVLDVLTDPPAPLQAILSAEPIGKEPGDLESLSGAAFTSFEANAVDATRSFQDTIAAHMARIAGRMGDDGGGIVSLAPLMQTASIGDPLGFGGLLAAAGTTATDAPGDNAVRSAPGSPNRVRPWVESYGRFDRLNSAGGAPGVNANGGTVVIGVDVPLDVPADGRAGLGGAVAYDFSDIAATSLSATQQQAYRISGYAWTSVGMAWVGGSLDYAHVTTQATRVVGFDADLGQSRVTPSGDVVSGQIMLAQPFTVAGLRLMPQAGLQGLHYDQAGFTETGTTGAELAVAGRSRDALASVIGLAAVARGIGVGPGLRLTPQVMIGWSHEFLDPTTRLDASFATGGPSFAVVGATPGRDALVTGAALSAQIGRAALYVSYRVSAAANDTTQTATAGLKLTW